MRQVETDARSSSEHDAGTSSPANSSSIGFSFTATGQDAYVVTSYIGSRAIVDLQSGKVGLAVVRERMKPGELIEVQTPHAVAAVRGTVLVVEIVPGQAGGDQPGGRPRGGAA